MIKKLIYAMYFAILIMPSASPAAPYQDRMGCEAPGDVFVDIVREGYRWGKPDGLGGWIEPTSADVDADGWPKTDAQWVVDYRPVAEWSGSIDDPQQYRIDRSGTYKCTFTGQATLNHIEGPFTIANQVYNSGTNTTTFDIVIGAPGPQHGLIVMTFTNTKRTPTSPTGNGLTNFRCIRPGYPADTTQLFRNELISCITSADFAVIRFMGVAQTNGNVEWDAYGPILQYWSNRKKTTDACWGSTMTALNKKDGWPWEYVIQLCNTVNMDLWINIPVAVDDAYIQQLAQLVYSNLNSNLNVYLEHSNEMWNWGFMQYAWNKAAAVNEVNGGGSNLNYDGSTDQEVWTQRRHARRVKQIVDIFASVFGTGQINQRIRGVLAGVGTDFFVVGRCGEMLTFLNAQYGAPRNYIYCISETLYYGGDAATGAAGTETYTVQQILNDMSANTDGQRTGRQQWISMASSWSLPGGVCSYEGGPDIGGGSTTNIANRIMAVRDAGMKDIYKKNFAQNFWDLGGNIAMQFALQSAYTRYGAWGITDDLANPDRNYLFQAVREMIGTGGVQPPGAASNPSPANSATNVSVTADLSWTAGSGATSHDVYFGTTSPGTFRGNQAGTTYDTGTMANSTTYYWRIDEKNTAGTTTGAVWSFTTVALAPPGQASNPSPANGATSVGITTDLSWTAGSGATSHDVYFGTASPGTFRGNQAGTTYDTGTMANGTTYYWRIDEKNANGTTTGAVWSFTTVGGGLPSPWLNQDVGSPSVAGSASYASGTFTVNGDGADIWGNSDQFQFVYQSLSGDGQIVARVATQQNTDGWAKAGAMIRETLTGGSKHAMMVITPSNGAAFQHRTATDGTSAHTAGDVVTAPYWVKIARSGTTFTASQSSNGTSWTTIGTETISMATNVYIGLAVTSHNGGALCASTIDNVTVTTGGAPGQASNPSPANGATSVAITTDLSWTAGAGATSHDVYFGTTSPGTFRGNQAGTTYDTGTMANNTTYYWRIDEKNASGTTTGVVWSFTTIVAAPGQASNPSPANGATGVSTTADLSWTAGSGATSHDVYFGTASSPPFVVNQTGTTYDTGTMANTTTYYWKIDEKNAGGTTTGTVWSFTTQAVAPPGQASNPSPANGATSVAITTDLSWTAGSGATSHDVYFGTTSPGTFRGNQAGTTYDTGTMTAGTTYYWRIDEKNAGGTTAGVVWSFTTASGPAPGNGTGLTGDYYDNMDFTAFALTRTDATVNFDWGSGSPDPAIGADTFSVSWTGDVQPLYSETYTFYTTSDDGVRLWVNGQLIINNWTDHASTVDSNTITLTAGVKYDIEMNYYENTGGAIAKLEWSSASQPREIIPQTQLYPVISDANIPQTATAPVIDGSVDSAWSIAPAYSINNITLGTVSSSADLSGTFKAMWDSTNLYYLVEITDDVFMTDSTSPWDDDTVEVFVDADNSKGTSYDGINDFQYGFRYNDPNVYIGTNSVNNSTGVVKAFATITGGYRMEVRVPWSTLGVTPVANNLIGTDVQVNDDDDGGTRDGKKAWFATDDNSWQNPSLFGTGKLTGTVPAPPGQASNPNPANGITGVSITADLTWAAGSGATSHDVYFGTVSPGTFRGNQAGTTYDTGTMANSTTYYWRIDEKNAGGTTTGIVWSFTTAGAGAAPAYVAAGAVSSSSSAITPALPSGIATNDILLLFLETANQAISISNQNGGTWTAVTNSPQGTGTAGGTSATRLTVFWSRYNGSQGAPTTSDSGNHQLGRIIAIRGAVTSGNPWDVTAGGVESTSDTSGSIPGATTTVANTLVVAAIATSLPDASGTANFSAWANGNLTSITERTDNTVTAGNGGGLGIVTGVKATAGAYGSTTVTAASSAVKGMMSIALKGS